MGLALGGTFNAVKMTLKHQQIIQYSGFNKIQMGVLEEQFYLVIFTFIIIHLTQY